MHKEDMKLPHKSIVLVFALPFVFQMAAAAGLDDSVARCQAIEDSASRLQCFDELHGPATTEAAPSVKETAKASQPNAAPATSSKVTATTRGTPPHTTTSGDDFPKTLEITRISKTIDDRHIFYMSDGSVWQEFGNGRKRFKANQTATIEFSSALGSSRFASYWMRIDGAKFQVISLR